MEKMKTRKSSTTTTKVIYRLAKYPDGEKEIIALFPYLRHKGNLSTCFTLRESHSSCDYDYMIKISRPALNSEYSPLQKTLEGIGYNLQKIEKINKKEYKKCY